MLQQKTAGVQGADGELFPSPRPLQHFVLNNKQLPGAARLLLRVSNNLFIEFKLFPLC